MHHRDLAAGEDRMRVLRRGRAVRRPTRMRDPAIAASFLTFAARSFTRETVRTRSIAPSRSIATPQES